MHIWHDYLTYMYGMKFIVLVTETKTPSKITRDHPTDGRTDTTSYRDATAHLKTDILVFVAGNVTDNSLRP